MPIQGYELPQHVIATLEALRREASNPKSEAHLEAIQGQIGLFEAELERMRAEAKAKAKARAKAEGTEWL